MKPKDIVKYIRTLENSWCADNIELEMTLETLGKTAGNLRLPMTFDENVTGNNDVSALFTVFTPEYFRGELVRAFGDPSSKQAYNAFIDWQEATNIKTPDIKRKDLPGGLYGPILWTPGSAHDAESLLIDHVRAYARVWDDVILGKSDLREVQQHLVLGCFRPDNLENAIREILR